MLCRTYKRLDPAQDIGSDDEQGQGQGEQQGEGQDEEQDEVDGEEEIDLGTRTSILATYLPQNGD